MFPLVLKFGVINTRVLHLLKNALSDFGVRADVPLRVRMVGWVGEQLQCSKWFMSLLISSELGVVCNISCGCPKRETQ